MAPLRRTIYPLRWTIYRPNDGFPMVRGPEVPLHGVREVVEAEAYDHLLAATRDAIERIKDEPPGYSLAKQIIEELERELEGFD